MKSNSIIYLDYNATTPVDPRVLEAMLPFFNEEFGNAASRQHRLGCRAAERVESARAEVARLIGSDSREIIFTSGATESNNLALKGVTSSPVNRSKGNHIITCRTEHKAILDPCARLEGRGFSVTRLAVDDRGLLDLSRLEDAIRPDTVLVTLMHANNETGVIHPLQEIGRLCRKHGVLFHTDATQAFGKVPIDVNRMGIDLLSLSAHKIYGAKGIGALYVRRRDPRVRCQALFDGGGHERGVRSGTLNVPGIVSLGAAAAICSKEMHLEQEKVGALRDRLQALLLEIGEVTLNGDREARVANTLNLSFQGVDGEKLMKSLPRIAVSSSSACTSATLQPSHVLGAMGRSDDEILGSVRFSLGRFTTAEEIEAAATAFADTVPRLRASAPSPK